MKRLTQGARLPEESLNGRLAVLAATAVADIAMAVTAGALLTTAVSLALVALGHRHSWRGRHKPRTRGGQALLGLLLLGCLAYLASDLTLGVFGGALPQAKFAVMAQAVTSFDLKSRRNLFTHLWHSAVILYVGAIFAWNPYYLPFVVAWAMGMFAFLHFTRRDGARSSRPRLARWMAVWLALSGVIFVAMPRFAARPIAVPLLVSMPLGANSSPEVLPSVLPLVGGQPGTGEESINLRVRGRLGEEVVLRVRSPAAGYWRAYTLEQYTGQAWARISQPAQPIPPVSVDLGAADEGPSIGTLPQSFFIERQLPADVIMAYPPKELYFPAHGLALANTGTIRSPVPLVRGINYSGVSSVRDVSAQHLRLAGSIDGNLYPDDLQLPGGLPRRVGQLAAGVSAGRTTEYDRVAAITNYLRTNYRYSLDTPRLPAGADAVDQFLFTDHVGFCEQFASALAVMLRSQGIPARLAVGYSTGDRDNLTGSFTVRARDAHAWVEVLFPGTGWVPFDASPGFDAVPANRLPSRWLLSDLSPQVAFTGLAGAPGGAAGGGLVIVALALATLVVVLVRRDRAAGHSPAVRAYVRAQRWLSWAGLPRRTPAETPREHLARLSSTAPPVAAAMAVLAADVERASFAGEDSRAHGSLGVFRAAFAWRLGWQASRPPRPEPA